MTPDAYIIDAEAPRLQVWTVRAITPEMGLSERVYIAQRWRVPAYTPTEAVLVAARMSGIDRADWGRYLWTPTSTHAEEGTV